MSNDHRPILPLEVALGVPATRTFDSGQLGIVSGVEPAKQALWRSRLLVTFERHRDVRSRTYGFDELLRWSLLGEALRFGIEISQADRIVCGAFDKGMGNAFEMDMRDRPGGVELYAMVKFRPGDVESFRQVTTFGGTNLEHAGDFFGRQCLIISVGAWQRAFAARLETL